MSQYQVTITNNEVLVTIAQMGPQGASATTPGTGGAVTSVAGRTGAVSLIKGDVGLDQVNNTSDANKPVSTAQQTALNAKESIANKDASNGYVGLVGFNINFKNVANTFTSLFTNTNTAIRTYLFPDKSGTVAMLSDITGTNSGVNTGDQSLFRTIAVSGQTDVVADTTTDVLTLVAGANVTLTTNAATDTITIGVTGGTQNTFASVAVAGQTTITADNASDTITLIAGSNIILTTDSVNDTITISSTGTGGGNSFNTIAVAGQTPVVADVASDTLTLVAGSGITITTNATADTITFSSTGGTGTGVTDGDKGDILVNGNSWTVQDIVTPAATIVSADSVIFRDATDGLLKTASAGVVMGTDLTSQIVTYNTGEVNTGTGVFGISDTVPTISQGTEFINVAITPANVNSSFEVEVVIICSNSVANTLVAALYRDSTSAAIASTVQRVDTANTLATLTLRAVIAAAGALTATTFRVRAGGVDASTTTFNGVSGARVHGGVLQSRITVKEYLP